MSSKSQSQNYVRVPDKDLTNDLKFYDGETSPLEGLEFLDKFIIDPMFDKGITCEFIVFRIRGKITDEVWTRLSSKTSKLAKNYTMTHQIEELSHVRDERMEYNEKTRSWTLFTEDHNIKPEDMNGGLRSKYHNVIFRRKNPELKSESCVWIPKGKKPKWYGQYFCCADSLKQAMYVKKDTFERPCERISSKPTKELEVVLENDFKKLTVDATQYHKIDALRRKIEVQIQDLEFLDQLFSKFIDDYTQRKKITKDRTQKIIEYLAQAAYTYKINESIRSQSTRNDTTKRKKYGQELIDKKKDLFIGVQILVYRIMSDKNWKFPPIPQTSVDYQKATHLHVRHKKKINLKDVSDDMSMSQILHGDCELHFLLSQLQNLCQNWIIAESEECDARKYWDRKEWQYDPELMGKRYWQYLSDEEKQEYMDHWDYEDDPEQPEGSEEGDQMSDGEGGDGVKGRRATKKANEKYDADRAATAKKVNRKGQPI
jgi:hypothetical protein